MPRTIGASVRQVPVAADEEEDDTPSRPPRAKKDEEEASDARRRRATAGNLTDADAGPVEIVVSRLRTDASRSRVMDDGRRPGTVA